MNQKWLKSKGVTLVETLAVIVLLALLIVLLTSRIGGILDRPKDLEVKRDLKQYVDAATALTPGNEDFNEDNINKFVAPALKVIGDESSTENPYDMPYKVNLIDKDNFIVTSDKLKNSVKVGEQVITVSRVNGRIEVKDEYKDTPSVPTLPTPPPPPVNVLDYYQFSDKDMHGNPIAEGVGVSLNQYFKLALNSNSSYLDWTPGEPVPNFGNIYNGEKVTSTKQLFYEVTVSILDASNLDMSNVVDAEDMFYYVTSSKINVKNWDTSNLENMFGMFSGIEALDLDVSGFDTSKVTNMCYTFNDMRTVNLNIDNLDTGNVIDMVATFSGSDMEEIDLSNWDMTNLDNMHDMFNYCKAKRIKLSSNPFNKVTETVQAFRDTVAEEIDLGGMDTSSITNSYQMFKNTTATKCYVKTQADFDKLDAIVTSPLSLVFTVK